VRGGVAVLAGFSLSRARAADARRTSDSEAATDVIAIADASFGLAVGEFAVEAHRLGIDVRGFAHDIGTLWLHEIGPALRAGNVTLVGLTGAGVLLCLETLVLREGFATIFRAERPPAGRGWASVGARHAFAAAMSAAPGGSLALPPIEHSVWPRPAEPRLLAWTIARTLRGRAAT
jgi:hypothetical protein